MIREDTQTTRAPESPAETPLQPVTVTEAAAAKLTEVMEGKGLTDAGLRVFVTGGGCSGLQYGMAFEETPEDDDHTFPQATGELTVYVDPVSMSYLQGAQVDYVESLMGGGFKIENPQAQASCGCGHSFRPNGNGQAAAGQGAAPQAQAGGGGGGCGCH